MELATSAGVVLPHCESHGKRSVLLDGPLVRLPGIQSFARALASTRFSRSASVAASMVIWSASGLCSICAATTGEAAATAPSASLTTGAAGMATSGDCTAGEATGALWYSRSTLSA